MLGRDGLRTPTEIPAAGATSGKCRHHHEMVNHTSSDRNMRVEYTTSGVNKMLVASRPPDMSRGRPYGELFWWEAGAATRRSSGMRLQRRSYAEAGKAPSECSPPCSGEARSAVQRAEGAARAAHVCSALSVSSAAVGRLGREEQASPRHGAASSSLCSGCPYK